MKMLNRVETPKAKLRAIRINCWVLTVALLLGIADPFAHATNLPRLANSTGTLDSPDRLPGEATLRLASDAPAGRTADRVLRDFARLLHYLQRAAGDTSDVALHPPFIGLPGQRSEPAGRWAPHLLPALLTALVAYRPHAPPVRDLPDS